MFSTRKKIWVLTIAAALLMACESKKSSPEEPVPTRQNHEDNGPVTPDPVASPVAAQSWCRMEDWKSFVVVLRMTAKGDQFETVYLRLSPNVPTVKYPFSSSTPWDVKKGSNPLEDNPRVGRFMVSLVPGPLAVTPKLAGLDEQKRIVEQVLPNYSVLAPRQGPFSPDVSLSVKTRDVYSGGVIEKFMYPCSSYSEAFNQEAPARPMMELILKISSSMDSFTEKNLNHVAQAMPLVEPVEEAPLDPTALEQTHWCAWREVEAGRLKLYTLSFADGKFIENAYTENFALAPDQASAMDFLTKNAALSEFYETFWEKGRLIGKNITQRERKYPDEELFSSVHDANGMKAIVRLSPKQPDLSRPYFDDIYFECSQSKPLEFSTAFRDKLPVILDLQAKILNPDAPTGP